MSTYEEYFKMLKPEDKAFCDGFMAAVKMLEENADLMSLDIAPDLPEDSLIHKAINEAVKIMAAAQVEKLNAQLHDLVLGTVDSYED